MFCLTIFSLFFLRYFVSTCRREESKFTLAKESSFKRLRHRNINRKEKQKKEEAAAINYSPRAESGNREGWAKTRAKVIFV